VVCGVWSVVCGVWCVVCGGVCVCTCVCVCVCLCASASASVFLTHTEYKRLVSCRPCCNGTNSPMAPADGMSARARTFH